MKSTVLLAALLAVLMGLGGCDPQARMSSKGFRLPDGDAQAGQEAFLYMQCHQCHSIEGMQLPEIPGRDAPYVELGGKVTKIKTYGELLTEFPDTIFKKEAEASLARLTACSSSPLVAAI